MNETAEVVENEEVSEADQAVMDAFVTSQESGGDEDAIKMAMCMAGAKFKQVAKLYNEYMVAYGFSASKEEKTEALQNAVDEFGIETEYGFNDAVVYISSEVNGVTETSAANMIRAFCKKEDIEVWKKPKAERGLRTDGFKFKFYKLLRENPTTTADELADFVKSNGSENDIRYMSTHQAIRQLCNDIAS